MILGVFTTATEATVTIFGTFVALIARVGWAEAGAREGGDPADEGVDTAGDAMMLMMSEPS
jgi:hypothetical protein